MCMMSGCVPKPLQVMQLHTRLMGAPLIYKHAEKAGPTIPAGLGLKEGGDCLEIASSNPDL